MFTLFFISLVVMIVCGFILINYVLPKKSVNIHESLAAAAAIIMLVSSVGVWVGLIGIIIDLVSK